jgi:hypothetical protein
MLLFFGLSFMFHSRDLLNLSPSSEIHLCYTIMGTTITIDDSDPQHSWESTRDTYPWCTGLGTQLNPYVIQNLILDLQGAGNCLVISNSDQYFIIQNCEFRNAGEVGIGVGLYGVQYGVLDNNLIYNSSFIGLECSNSAYLQVEQNQIKENVYGVELVESAHIILVENIIDHNTIDNIGVFGCVECSVIENDISYSSKEGIIVMGTNHSSFNLNHIYYNNDGIKLSRSSLNEISDNIIQNHAEYGIMAIYESNHNLITDNTLSDNQYCMGIGQTCVGNQIERNGACQLFIIDDTTTPPPDDDPPPEDPEEPPKIPNMPFLGWWALVAISSLIVVLRVIKRKEI